MTCTRALVATVLALAAVPALAAEQIFLLQTQESGDVAAPCPGQNIKLGAYVYAPRTRAADGQVMKQLGRPVGSAVGCGVMREIKPGSKAPFNMTFDIGGQKIFAAGECTVADWFFPIPAPAPVLLVGCYLSVAKDDSQGLLHGIATSASVFIPFAIPGYETGSFWTLHLYTKDPGGAQLP
jgi:hypothetical protein